MTVLISFVAFILLTTFTIAAFLIADAEDKEKRKER